MRGPEGRLWAGQRTSTALVQARAHSHVILLSNKDGKLTALNA
jgi:hypothetical protein